MGNGGWIAKARGLDLTYRVAERAKREEGCANEEGEEEGEECE